MRTTCAWLALAAALLLTSAFPALAFAECGCGVDCQCGPSCGCGLIQPPPANPDANKVRKNQATLSDQEQQEFVEAVLELQRTKRAGVKVSIYDEYVHLHHRGMMEATIHEGPAFFPWHRQYLRNFELELQAINPKVTIPYWDFTLDNSKNSSIWSKHFMGGDGDPKDNFIVKSGPFRQGEWSPAYEEIALRRHFGGFFRINLPGPEDLARGMLVKRYDVAPFNGDSDIRRSFRNYMTGWSHPSGESEMHNRVHEWVGGSMLTMTSPNDPVFWLMHSFLDKTWAEWMATHGPDYPKSGAQFGHNLRDPLYIFGSTPRSVLRHHRLGYYYDSE